MSATLSAAPEVQIRETECFIDGKWVPAKSGKTFATINPATEEEIAQVAEGEKEDVDAAAKAARWTTESVGVHAWLLDCGGRMRDHAPAAF